MWTIRRSSNSRRLVIGCGRSYLDHAHMHEGCDLLDAEEEVDPDILANMWDAPGFAAARLTQRYSAILCEFLPGFVYNRRVFYENLDFLRAPGTPIIFLSVAPSYLDEVVHHCAEMGWRSRICDFDEVPLYLFGTEALAERTYSAAGNSPTPSVWVM